MFPCVAPGIKEVIRIPTGFRDSVSVPGKQLYSQLVVKRRRRQPRRKLMSSGSPLETLVGFSHAVRVGNTLAVTGTAPSAPGGGVAAPGSVYGHTKRCLEIVTQTPADAGLTINDVIRCDTLYGRTVKSSFPSDQ
jgi:enamine deaminase RidA (YjgF/YER057c/UK114 family)